MIPELLPVWKRWEETHAALLDWVAQFPEDRYTWQPAPKTTTAGEIVAHVVWGEMGYALRALREPVERVRATVTDRQSAEAALAQSREFALRAFETLSAADLEQEIAVEWAPLGPPVEGPLSALWFLEQMIRHKAYHLGQLWYVSMLLAE